MAARPRRLRHNLQTRILLALMLIGLLPLGLVGFGIATLNHQELARQSARELTGLARGLAGKLEVYLSELLGNSRGIAALPEIVSMDAVRQEALLKEIYHHHPAFTRLETFDPAGAFLAASDPRRPPATSVQQSFVHQSFWNAAKYGRQIWEVTRMHPSRQAVLLINTPIRDATRRVIGVVSSTIALDYLSTFVGKVHVGKGGQAFVLNAAGQILLHPDQTAVHERHDYSWLGVPAGGHPTGTGIIRYASQSETRIAGYAPIPDIGWTVVVERPEAEVLAPAYQAWRLALVGLGISACLVVLSAVFLAHLLTCPVSDKRRHLDQLERV